MQFLLLIYEDESRFQNGYPEAEMSEYRAFRERNSGAIKGGHQLQLTRTAKSVRIRNGKQLITDGPFAETKEQLGGFFLVEADNTDAAVALALKIPGARSGVIEVRPIVVHAQPALAGSSSRKETAR